jgi:hypothetical protein
MNRKREKQMAKQSNNGRITIDVSQIRRKIWTTIYFR